MSRASRYIAVAFSLLREHHVFTERVNWPALRARALAGAAHVGEPSDTYPALRAAIAELGDPHTWLAAPERTRRRRRTAPPPTGHRLGPDLAYLGLSPPVEGANTERYVESAAHLIRRLDAANPRGWVLDLRGPVGEFRPGTMWPLLTALAPLLGEGLAGGFIEAGGRQSGWVVHDGQIYLDGTVMCPGRNGHLTWWPDLPVAVLTGPGTASAAEAAVVAFRGRPGSFSFGTPTRGLATGDTAFVLPDGARLHITTHLFQDRTGVVHGDRPIVPDLVTGEPDRDDDPALGAASAWLRAIPGETVDA